jgi:RNA polymerase sigma factor (sigma-70 family)
LAWSLLVNRLTPMLRSVAHRYRLGDDDVQEAVQETWAKCFQTLKRLRRPAALPGWLATTCHREAMGILRRDGRCVPTADDALDAAGSLSPTRSGDPRDPVEAVLDGELLTLLGESVAQLPERQRLLIDALVQHDGRYDRISATLEIPIGSIGPTRQRAIVQLRQRFHGRGMFAA